MKIRLKEIVENKSIVIHCDTFEKAEKLCKAANKFDIQINSDNFDRFKENTCYNLNNTYNMTGPSYGSLPYYAGQYNGEGENLWNVVEFEDVVFDEEIMQVPEKIFKTFIRDLTDTELIKFVEYVESVDDFPDIQQKNCAYHEIFVRFKNL